MNCATCDFWQRTTTVSDGKAEIWHPCSVLSTGGREMIEVEAETPGTVDVYTSPRFFCALYEPVEVEKQ